MELKNRDHEDRPWGSFERFTLNEKTTVKVISANPHQALSLQYHNHRDEFWRILSGSCTVALDGTETPAKTGDEFFIPRLTRHRVKTTDDAAVWLEISFGEFDETDIVRLEDLYNRTQISCL